MHGEMLIRQRVRNLEDIEVLSIIGTSSIFILKKSTTRISPLASAYEGSL